MKARILIFFVLALLVVDPLWSSRVFAQDRQSPSVSAPATQAAPPEAIPQRTLTLTPDYSMGKKWFPNFVGQYVPMQGSEPSLTNSPRIDQLLQNGKLMLSLQDAISLALENNLAIAVERYTPWLDEVNLLRAKSGINGLIPFDPAVTGTLNLQDSATPLNNPLFAGIIPTGTTLPVIMTPPAYVQHIGNVNFQYNQDFPAAASRFWDSREHTLNY
jgi:hypothetical protein